MAGKTFVATLQLKPNRTQKKVLWKISDVNRQLYNVTLAETFKRIRKMKRSKEYRLNKNEKRVKERNRVYNELRENYKINKYELEKFSNQTKNNSKFIAKISSAHICQKTSNRAFQAAEKMMFGKAKKVKFKRKVEFFTLENKDNKNGFSYENGKLLIKTSRNEFSIPVQYRANDKWLQEALGCRVKYCRVVRKVIKGEERFYLQLIVEGIPYQKNISPKGKVALDIGPSTVAIVSKEESYFVTFCPEVQEWAKEKRKIQRKMERSRRAMNPNNYNPNGTVKKGARKWIKSNTYLKDKIKIAETERLLTSKRNQSHGRYINKLLSLGDEFYLEKLSYVAFQKMFGKSIGQPSPGSFVEKLRKKCEILDLQINEFSTYSTALSQKCVCGLKKKKKLSQRTHRCDCGVTAHRDVFSAYLALFVEKDTLNETEAYNNWSTYEKNVTNFKKAI